MNSRETAADCQLCFKGLRRQNKGFLFGLKYSMCAECIWQNFFHFKQTTKTVNKKQTKKLDNQWKKKLKTFHGPFYKTSNPF